MSFQDVAPSIQLEEADGCDAVSSCQEDRVDTHKNAPMTPVGRLRMVQAVEAGESMRAVAYQCRTDPKSVRKWVHRYRTGRSRPARSQLAAASLATRYRASHRATGHYLASPALDDVPHCGGAAHLARDRVAGVGAGGIEPSGGARTSTAAMSL